jgi:hypothetical protein
MREIKFRAWDKENEKMMKVSSLHLENKEISVKENGTFRLFRMQDLMQYTGLNDKNGKEIYENDLISCNKHKNIVVFFEGGCFKVKYLRNSTTTITCTLNSFLEKYKCKISGNIYEHPELLEEQK